MRNWDSSGSSLDPSENAYKTFWDSIRHRGGMSRATATKANTERCQGPSSEIFSARMHLCGLLVSQASCFYAAPSRGESCETSGTLRAPHWDRCSTAENHRLKMVACQSLPVSDFQSFYHSMGTGCMHNRGQFECRIFHLGFRHEA